MMDLAGIAFLVVVVAIAVVDLRTKYIYDWMLIAGAVICYPLLLLRGGGILSGLLGIALGAAVGAAFYGIIWCGAYLVYKREAFGMGDVLFNGFLCGFLGWQAGILSSFLSFYIALIFVLIGAIRNRKLSGQTEIPFGPSMAVAAVVTMFFYTEIMNLIFPGMLG